MNKKRAIPTIDFADSKYQSFKITNDDILTLYFNNWREEPLEIIFSETVQFFYRLGQVPAELYEIIDNTSFLKEALLLTYEKIPEEYPYKLFQFEDIYDFPFIQVVATSVEVIKSEPK